MKSIIITGSTSGIGLGLADAFLVRGCTVTISGHSRMNLEKAYETLAGRYDKSRIHAYLCDVSQ
jgi:NAD(P)-dependent dehydrogenase (short-subunit alcohol dehydrogenase family)